MIVKSNLNGLLKRKSIAADKLKDNTLRFTVKIYERSLEVILHGEEKAFITADWKGQCKRISERKKGKFTST